MRWLIILKYDIYTYSHGLISRRHLAGSSPTLWGSAGQLFSNVHKVLSINLNLDLYSSVPCHLHYTCALPINHWRHVQKAKGIISGNLLCFRLFAEFFFCGPLSTVPLSTLHSHPSLRRVCFATGARNARLWNNSLHDMVRNKTGHTALKIKNMCPLCTR